MNHVKTYTISLIPTNDRYRAVCLGLPDCAVAGRTKEEALDRIEDLIRTRIAHARVSGAPLPVDRTSTKFIWLDVEEFLV